MYISYIGFHANHAGTLPELLKINNEPIFFLLCGETRQEAKSKSI